LDKHTPELRKNGMMKEKWMVQFLQQNAFGIYCTWCCIATLLNMAMIGAYVGQSDQATMSTIALSILLMEVLIWVSLDTFVLQRYSNYLFTPHLVLVWALSGSLAKNYNPWTTNTIMTVVLLTLACAATVMKIVIMLWRHFRTEPDSPLVSPSPSPEPDKTVA